MTIYQAIDCTLMPPLSSDKGICDAARVSFSKQAANFTDENNSKLLRYLKEHLHWSPFGHAREIFSFLIRQEDALHFFAHANLSGFTWLMAPDTRMFLCGSAWAFHENLGWLPKMIADDIRRFYYTKPQYSLSSRILFREVDDRPFRPVVVQHSPPRDLREYADLTSVSFRIKAPIFVARQLVKHQKDLCWNEESRRYIDSEPTFFKPHIWRARPTGGIKQGSKDERAPMDADTLWRAERHTTEPVSLYNQMIRQDAAPELARMVLPQSALVEWIWTGSVRAFKRVCNLRLDPHAQQETQMVAKMIDAQMKIRVPVIWESLEKEPPYIERG